MLVFRDLRVSRENKINIVFLFPRTFLERHVRSNRKKTLFSSIIYVTLATQFIYSWSLNHILKHEFFCLGRFGISGYFFLNIPDQLLRVVFSTFCGQKNSKLIRIKVRKCFFFFLKIKYIIFNRLPLRF